MRDERPPLGRRFPPVRLDGARRPYVGPMTFRDAKEAIEAAALGAFGLP
jgi:hypothetical protein